MHAGLEIAEVVAGLQTRALEKLAVRVGIATGLVVVGDIVGQGPAQEQAVVGDTPNLAARLQGLAEAGGVVVAAATRRLHRRRFRLEGPRPARGQGPRRAGRGVGGARRVGEREPLRGGASARLAGFVGREAESAELLVRQRRAWGGQGQIVLISGEAGIGKSRLSAWLAEQVADDAAYAAALPMLALSPRQRALSLRAAIRARGGHRAAGAARGQARKAREGARPRDRPHERGRAADRLDAVDPDGGRYPPLNLSPAQQRRQTLSALLDQIEGLAKKQPVLMLFEDAHWADATSLEVLDLAIERVRRLPVLLLVTSRPEFEAPWKGLPDVAEIALQPLRSRARRKRWSSA